MTHSRISKLILVAVFLVVMMLGFRYAASRNGTIDRISNRQKGESIFDKLRSSTRREMDPNKEELRAEVEYSSQIPLDDESKPSAEVPSDKPVLPANRPDWVAAADDVSGETHIVSIAGDLESSIEVCRDKFDQALVDGVRRYIERHLSPQVAGNTTKLTHLDSKWIREHLAKKAPEYEAVIERPSGEYHQLWTLLSIDADDRRIMIDWIEQLETRKRVAMVGFAMAAAIVMMSGLHLSLGIFARSPKVG